MLSPNDTRNIGEPIANGEPEGKELFTDFLREAFFGQMKLQGATKGECATAALEALKRAERDFVLHEGGLLVGRGHSPVATTTLKRAGRGQVLTREQQVNLPAKKSPQHLPTTSRNATGVPAKRRAQILTRKQAARGGKTM